MASLKKTIAALEDILTAKWLWYPIFFGCSILVSFALFIHFSWYGVAIFVLPYSIIVIKEALRQKNLKPHNEWETCTDIRELAKAYAEEQKRKRAEKAQG